MEMRQLSSWGTGFRKFLAPCIVPGIIIVHFLVEGPRRHWNIKSFALFTDWPVAVILGGILLADLFNNATLKRIRMDEKNLYVSNYFSEIKIPLTDVEDVKVNRWLNDYPITVTFRTRTEFGLSVKFIPKIKWMTFSEHQIIMAELKSAISNARGEKITRK